VNHARDQKVTRQIVSPNDPQYKEIVFQRQVKACPYLAGQRVKVRRGHQRGYIKEIIKDLNEVQWENNKPHFILVEHDDKKFVVYNPSQIKRSK